MLGSSGQVWLGPPRQPRPPPPGRQCQPFVTRELEICLPPLWADVRHTSQFPGQHPAKSVNLNRKQWGKIAPSFSETAHTCGLLIFVSGTSCSVGPRLLRRQGHVRDALTKAPAKCRITRKSDDPRGWGDPRSPESSCPLCSIMSLPLWGGRCQGP